MLIADIVRTRKVFSHIREVLPLGLTYFLMPTLKCDSTVGVSLLFVELFKSPLCDYSHATCSFVNSSAKIRTIF